MARSPQQLQVEDVLGEEGLIQHHIAGFEVRRSQLSMAQMIQQAIEAAEHRVIEASTGIGKSFAYLVPLLASPHKAIVSTGTRNLQDQLFNKDLPLMVKTLGSSKSTALLKGRSNYCCPYRIQKHRQHRRFQTRHMAPLFTALHDWSQTTRSGDIAEFSDLPENDSLWFYATSNADNCLGGDCPEFEQCFVLKARRKAQQADLVVINHHLFFSDQALREQGFGELLPDTDVVVFDEAHQLPGIASHFYGNSVTLRQFDQLVRDLHEAQKKEAKDDQHILDRSASLHKAVADFRLTISQFNSRAEWRIIANAPAMQQAVTQVNETIAQLDETLQLAKSRGRELASCLERLTTMTDVWQAFMQPGSDQVSWYEWSENSFRLSITPVDIADQFKRQLAQNDYRSLIFTSATLSADGNFDYFTARLGLQDVPCSHFDSPFCYHQQALLFLPEALPEPNAEEFPEQFVATALPLIRAAQGNCFILFTSYRMLMQVAQLLRGQLSNRLLVQGERQRSELLQEYLETAHAILLGTSSFWEGVDVKGEKLKLVIIDRLPFRSPYDPLYRRRLQYCSQQGGNPFMDIQVPEAIISLRQGIGRLIRDSHDRGVVMIADRRIQTRPYGRNMLQSLPSMSVTQDIDEVVRFLQ